MFPLRCGCQETWNQCQRPVASAGSSQALVRLSSSGAYSGVYPIVSFKIMFPSHLAPSSKHCLCKAMCMCQSSSLSIQSETRAYWDRACQPVWSEFGWFCERILLLAFEFKRRETGERKRNWWLNSSNTRMCGLTLECRKTAPEHPGQKGYQDSKGQVWALTWLHFYSQAVELREM